MWSEDTVYGLARRKQVPYVPDISGPIRYIYDASCFLWCTIIWGLLRHENIWKLSYSTPLVFMLSMQNIFSYMGDSHEFLNTGKLDGPWGWLDRVWAVLTLSLSVVFVFSNGVYYIGIISYACCVATALTFWTTGLVILRVEGGNPNAWACCHIMWHFFLCLGGLTVVVYLPE